MIYLWHSHINVHRACMCVCVRVCDTTSCLASCRNDNYLMNSNEFGPYQVVQLPGAKKDEVSGQLYCDIAINCYKIIVGQI